MQSGPTEIAEKNAHEALKAFGVNADRLEATSGNTTSLWRVDAGDSSFVLRHHQRDAVPAIRTRHDLLRFLAERFHRAPMVRNAPQGDDIVTRPEGVYELLTFLPGEVAVTGWDFDWDDDVLLNSAAELLADLNLVLRTYEPPPDAVWYQPKSMAQESTVRALLGRDESAEASKILPNLDLVYKYLRSFPPDRTQRHVIHNDFAWYNIVRHGHSAIGVIDFDSAHVNSELHDLAYAVYAFAPINQSMKEQPRPVKRTAERVATFLMGYEERSRELLGLSAEAVFDAAAYRVAISAGSLIRGLVEGEERAVRLLSHAVGYAEWLRWYEAARPELIEAGKAVLA